MVTANAARRLIQHYVDNFRQLPWRSPPGARPPEPYLVWLSEVMLQQTTVATVIPRFERFISRWPTVDALAAATDAEILSEWAGLGYYARARNLISCGREIARRGSFPASAADLRALPGIGAYTSAAIAAIAFGEKAAAVDTNVARVISRLLGLAQSSRGEIQQAVCEMMQTESPGNVVQALMDLGATICRPARPRCASCPLRFDCAAFASGDPARFPERRERKPRPHRFGTVWWIERDGQLWLVRRPAQGLLGGMTALPGSEWSDDRQPLHNPLGTIRHVFTHFSLDLDVVAGSEPIGEGWWHPVGALAAAGLPTLYRKAADLALALEERRAA